MILDDLISKDIGFISTCLSVPSTLHHTVPTAEFPYLHGALVGKVAYTRRYIVDGTLIVSTVNDKSLSNLVSQ